MLKILKENQRKLKLAVRMFLISFSYYFLCFYEYKDNLVCNSKICISNSKFHFQKDLSAFSPNAGKYRPE